MSSCRCCHIANSYCHLDNKTSDAIVNMTITCENHGQMPRQRKIFGIHRPARRPRRRRTPDEARTELLDAAERVFVEFQPEQVGLKDIAREAGVSHALVTHYFGTYGGLVEATLERRVRALRSRIMAKLREAGALARPIELLGMLFQALEDPVHLRLVKWLIASERPNVVRAFALQDQGLQTVARAVAEALAPHPDARQLDIIELALTTAVAAAFGYATSKYALASTIGRQVSPELDAGVQRTLAGMLQAYVREQLGMSFAPQARPG